MDIADDPTPELAPAVADGALAVARIADYFQELKTTVRGLRQTFGARQRGYFTPSEDEAVRQLTVSYWQTRAALFELILSLRDRGQTDGPGRADAFLVTYAAAILLVDAAQFIRHELGDSAVVMAKLNEPEPHFGIPVGVYDTVQRSLTSPVNAWHLYNARSWYCEHEAELRRRASRHASLVAALGVIESLGGCVNVTAAEYARARLHVRAEQVLQGARSSLSQALYGLQEAASRLVSEVSTMPGHQPTLPPAVQEQLRALLRPGDVLVVRKEHALTNYFLPGFWPHAALFVGTPDDLRSRGLHEHEHVRPRWPRIVGCDAQEPRRVLEALKDGVRVRPVRSPFASDAIAVIRPTLSEDLVTAALARAFFHEGKPYDFDFDFTRSDRLVCSEVVYRAYEGVAGVTFNLTRRAGRLTLAAEDLLRMALARQAFEPIAAYCPTCESTLCEGQRAAAVLQATISSPH